ncbi:MAG TPA: HD domain-containing protein [Thermomicrobiales bacterium]|nr:HD domain-containing protein [Thermomicrobiales bacterium]
MSPDHADIPAADVSSAEPKYDATPIDPDSVTDEVRTRASLSFEAVKGDPEVRELISSANRNLGVLGFTEHGFRHVGLVANIAHNVMARLHYDERHQELSQIAGYMHDIGNVISRHGHASTSALLAHTILTRMGMNPEDVIVVMSAIGSHGDDSGRLGEPVHPVSAALILADKSDVHRSRVRITDPADFDEHDQMNYATTSSFLRVDEETATVTLELQIDTSMASVMKYFELFLPRMQMCRRAANLLDQTFRITINDVAVL